MSIEIIKCEDWNDFKNRIMMDTLHEGKFNKGKYLFRGQASSEWKLQSSFDRLNIQKRYKKEMSEKLFKNFLKECEQENLPSEIREDDILMLSLGQHFGLPTRLLDWSESPYVASFFAFSNQIRNLGEVEEYVAIWVIDTDDYIWEEMHGCSIINIPSFSNIRIYNQQGKFTLLNSNQDSIDEYVESYKENYVYLKKYLIPVKDSSFAMSDLHAMGLDHSRIYPGLDGKAKAALVKVQLEQNI